MTRREALVCLNMVLDIGSIRLKKLLEVFGEPQEILKASPSKLMSVSGIGEKIAGRIASLKVKDLDKEFKEALKLKVKIITLEDKEYPENLKNIYDPPIVLYVAGEFTSEDANSLAIVGSRRASVYGLSSAERFAYQLAQRSITVISGLARGVDTFAHRGALKAGGRTVAVMGSGFNEIYPPENKQLSDEIAKNGAVISEFPLDTQPLPHNFPRRNRVISGLSKGVLVVEAARNSGALITANFALEQGREVFALPGKVDADNSFGTNALIKDGARLVTCVEDIFEEFLGVSADTLREIKPVQKAFVLDANEQELCKTLSDIPLQLDELIQRTNFSIPDLSNLLLRLQMKKIIKQLPGKHYLRRGNHEE